MTNARPIVHPVASLIPDTLVTMTATAFVPQRSATRFWIFAGIGILVMVVAWCWYGMAQLEAESEQGKALNAGTTMEGFGFTFGGIPLIAAHVIGIATLMRLGWQRYRSPGLAYGVIAVATASAIGIGAGQLLLTGQLFEVGLQRYYGG